MLHGGRWGAGCIPEEKVLPQHWGLRGGLLSPSRCGFKCSLPQRGSSEHLNCQRQEWSCDHLSHLLISFSNFRAIPQVMRALLMTSGNARKTKLASCQDSNLSSFWSHWEVSHSLGLFSAAETLKPVASGREALMSSVSHPTMCY